MIIKKVVDVDDYSSYGVQFKVKVSRQFFEKYYDCCKECLVKAMCLQQDESDIIYVTNPCSEFNETVLSYIPSEYE